MNLSNPVETQRSRRTRRDSVLPEDCSVGSAFAPSVLYVAMPASSCRGSNRPDKRGHLFRVLALGLALAWAGCGNRAQEQAYAHAVQAEAQFTVEAAPALVAEYRRVIALDPGTAWAKQAEARIAAVEARVKAEELHKAVFQEHGVD